MNSFFLSVHHLRDEDLLLACLKNTTTTTSQVKGLRRKTIFLDLVQSGRVPFLSALKFIYTVKEREMKKKSSLSYSYLKKLEVKECNSLVEHFSSLQMD
jgi:hypothetical protein